MLLRKPHPQLWLNVLLPDHPRQLEHLGSVKVSIIECCMFLHATCFLILCICSVMMFCEDYICFMANDQWHLNSLRPYWWFTYIRNNKVLLHSSCMHQINLWFIYWSIYMFVTYLQVATIIYPCFVESTTAKIGNSTTDFIVYGKFNSNLCLASRSC